MQVTQRVEGYVDMRSGKACMYKELQQRNPNMKPRMRNFRTTGVVVCVNGNLFKQGGIKRAFADRLVETFEREFSIAPRDVSAASAKLKPSVARREAEDFQHERLYGTALVRNPSRGKPSLPFDAVWIPEPFERRRVHANAEARCRRRQIAAVFHSTGIGEMLVQVVDVFDDPIAYVG